MEIPKTVYVVYENGLSLGTYVTRAAAQHAAKNRRDARGMEVEVAAYKIVMVLEHD